MAKSKQGKQQGADILPQQKTDPQSEFSVNESLKQASAEDHGKEHQGANKKSQQQQQSDDGQAGQEDSGRSSESEFSVSQRLEED